MTDTIPGPDKASIASFLVRQTRELSLRDGTRVRIRPVSPDDKGHIVDGLARLSEESRYRRFMTPLDTLSEDRLRYLTELDYHDHFAWIAFAAEQPGEPGIAVARYVRDPARPEVAEPAVAVVDDYQGRGLGTLLLTVLATTAVEHGIRRFRASLLADNAAMHELLKQQGAEFRQDGPGTLAAEVELPGSDRARAQLLYGMIRNRCEAAIARARRVLLDRTP